LFEKYIQNIQSRKAPIQQLLFPRTIELSKHDYALAHEIMEEMRDIGFDVADFGTNCLIINGVPAETAKGSEKELLEGLLEYFKHHANEFAGDKRKALALALAQNEAILRSKTMEHEELIGLLERLFACENPGSRPNGKPVYIELNQEKIADLFR
jgi:DNA mismatch repair protein MutL